MLDFWDLLSDLFALYLLDLKMPSIFPSFAQWKPVKLTTKGPWKPRHINKVVVLNEFLP